MAALVLAAKWRLSATSRATEGRACSTRVAFTELGRHSSSISRRSIKGGENPLSTVMAIGTWNSFA